MEEEAFVVSLRKELQSLRQQLLEDFHRRKTESGLDLLKAHGQADEEASSNAKKIAAKQDSDIRRCDDDHEISDVQRETAPDAMQAIPSVVDFGLLPHQRGNCDGVHPMAPADVFGMVPASPGSRHNGNCDGVQPMAPADVFGMVPASPGSRHNGNFDVVQPTAPASSQPLCLNRIHKKKMDMQKAEVSAESTYFTKARRVAHAILSYSDKNLLLDEDAAENIEFLKRIKSSKHSDTTIGAALAGYDSSLRFALAKFLFSGFFEGFVLLLIVSNSVWLGVQVEFAALHLQEEPPRSFRVLETLFSLFFGLELLLRLFVFRASFCAGRDCWWNLFDLALVSVQVAEEIAFAYGVDRGALASSMVLRCLRLCRAIRVVRIMRVLKYLRELRLLLKCILRSIKAFLWAVVLLGIMNYMCSIFFTSIVTAAREEGKDGLELLYWHGSVQRSFLSLLQGMIGGCDWDALVQPFLAEGMPVPGTFVDSAIHWANEERKTHTIDHMKHMFKCIDLDASGQISFDEIKSQLHAKPVQDFFKQIDVHTDDAEMLFKVLDGDGTGALSLEEFVHGCMRLQTPSTALDILLLSQEIRASMDEIRLNQSGQSSEAWAAAAR